MASVGGIALQILGVFGSLQTKFFRRSKKHSFFAVFANRLRTLMPINEYRHLVNFTFFIFVPKQVKNLFKKNIVSNLPWITDLEFSLIGWRQYENINHDARCG